MNQTQLHERVLTLQAFCIEVAADDPNWVRRKFRSYAAWCFEHRTTHTEDKEIAANLGAGYEEFLDPAALWALIKTWLKAHE